MAKYVTDVDDKAKETEKFWGGIAIIVSLFVSYGKPRIRGGRAGVGVGAFPA
ncbi:12019_t:CDS:2, partial [Racocetra fulgida]